MYRFRTIDNLLGKYKELENQEIYFSSPEELNDPMEGYRDIFWHGDEIVWRNFIVNYIKSAEAVFGLTILLRDEKPLEDSDIKVLSHSSTYRTKDHIKLIDQIIQMVFDIEFIQHFPSGLAKRSNQIRRNELLAYLQMLHPFIINSISDCYFKNGLIERRIFYQDLKAFSAILARTENLADLSDKIETPSGAVGGVLETFFSITTLVFQQTMLIGRYNHADRRVSKNNLFLVADFPEKYLSRLEQSIYPNWYSASFLTDCTNSAVWGHYGHNHQGVCLKFKVRKNVDDFELDLETEYGYSSGPTIGMRPHPFRQITYTAKHTQIDFFRSIGRLNRGELNRMWYSDTLGNLSVCGEHLNKDEDAWREKYWDNFYKSLTEKLGEWSYENEYRLIISGDLVDYSEKKSRKLKYQFNDLEAIIFGMKTSAADKIMIMKIIEDKCRKDNRNNFDFYQAYYSKDRGKIESFKLNLLKFDKKE